MALSFGVTALPDPPYTELISVMQEAEKLGFESGWTYDSHILWQESYATLPLVGLTFALPGDGRAGFVAIAAAFLLAYVPVRRTALPMAA